LKKKPFERAKDRNPKKKPKPLGPNPANIRPKGPPIRRKGK